MKKLLLVTLTLFLAIGATAGNYSVKVGSQVDIYCTVSPPAGYITHAFYSLADPSDAAYLALYSHSSECYATVTGLSPKSSIKIEVTYAYSYTGSYDHKTHVGQGTYYDYVTVTGGSQPTDVAIQEGNCEMIVGETITLHAAPTPSNASTSYSWGVIDTFGKPYNFTLTGKGPIASVYAKGEGQLYVLLQTANEKIATAIITAVKKEIPATSFTVESQQVTLSIEQKYKIPYSMTPSGANSSITWTSDNTNVATVTTSGYIVGRNQGNTVIRGVTDNRLSVQVRVHVLPNASQIAIQDFSLFCGYATSPAVKIIPAESQPTINWKSSDASIVEVSDDGLVIARNTGTAVLTATCTKGGASSSCKVTVTEAPKGLDIRNVKQRISAVNQLVKKSLEQNRNENEE